MINKNPENVLVVSKAVYLEVSAGKPSMYTFMPYQQDSGRNHNSKIANKSLGNVVKFGYLGRENRSQFMKKF
jgi:hypothetical protein